MQLNQPAPEFELPDLQGKRHKLNQRLPRQIVIVTFGRQSVRIRSAHRSLHNDLSGAASGDVNCCPLPQIETTPPNVCRGCGSSRATTVRIDAEHFVADIYEAVTTPHAFVMIATEFCVIAVQWTMSHSGREKQRAFYMTKPRSTAGRRLRRCKKQCIWMCHRA